MENNSLLLACGVAQCGCDMLTFWENVGNDKQQVMQQVAKATSMDEIYAIINNYI